MVNLIPLVDWGMGTALIVIFALVCIGLTALVLSFVFGGKKKTDDTPFPSDEEKL
jgi:uncharacterized membrane protein